MSIYESLKVFDPHGVFSLELDRTSYLIDRVKNHSVLHVGCSDYPITADRLESGTLLHASLTKECSRLIGIDNSNEGVNLLREQGFHNVVLMDAENLTIRETFDFIVAGDVLEHMSNPGKFLERARSLLNPRGILIIGVPNAYSFNILKFLINRSEPTHRDHAYFFSVKTLSELCSRYGFLPTKLLFTTQPKEPHEGHLYIAIRNLLINLQKKLAPSFIMEFSRDKDLDSKKFYEWK